MHTLITSRRSKVDDMRAGYNGEPKTQVTDVETIRFGDDTIDLSAVEQLFDKSQTCAIAQALVLFMQRVSQPVWRGRTLDDILTALDAEMDKDVRFIPRPSGQNLYPNL